MLDRRQMLSVIAGTGVGTAVFHGAVVALAQESSDVTADMLKEAEWITGVELSDEDREKIVDSVKQTARTNEELRGRDIKADVAPALHFQPLPSKPKVTSLDRNISFATDGIPELPDTDEGIAFLPVHQLSKLIRTGKLTSERLTGIYLDRLRKYSPMLKCVVTLTPDLALKQAKRADEELKAGNYRGPLHGIPWGAKDLIGVPGYPTTWGIPLHKDRMQDEVATVASRLEKAGAVLVAKLSLGALAMGDKWFGGMTRNPWNPKQGSSGSSAGSASSVVAGLVGFTLGSETLGSILSPSRRCGSTGFRPTFGRVSRHGCMPLSWSMDKIGPICRSIEDCALVFNAIHGEDGLDLSAGNFAFSWPKKVGTKKVRIGVVKLPEPKEEDAEANDAKQRGENAEENAESGNGRTTKLGFDPLEILQGMNCELVEVQLPDDIPLRPLTEIISIEGASVFDRMLRAGQVDGWNTWPESFRSAQYISAVDYLRYQRLRTQLMHQFEEAIKDVDLLFNMRDLVHTNFTGHPSVILPMGYRDRRDEGAKSVITATFTGHLNDDDKVLSIAHAFQQKMDAHLQQPPMDFWLEKFEAGELDEKKDEEEKDGEKQNEEKKDGGNE